MATTATAAVQTPVTRRHKMSYNEYLEFAGNSQIVEWVEGEVIVYMPPGYKHQEIVGFLSNLLNLFLQLFDLGVLLPAPFEVKLWPDGPSREPDLVFIRRKNLEKLTPERFEGGPDLVIEIVSPGSVSEDRVRKFAQYEQAGVQEYWIIDPRPHQQQADFYVLGQDDLFHAATLAPKGRYRSTVIPDFWLSLDWLWQEPLPNPQLALAEIMISIEALPADVKNAYQALYEALTPKE